MTNVDKHILLPEPRHRIGLALFGIVILLLFSYLLVQNIDLYSTMGKLATQTEGLSKTAMSHPVVKVNRQQLEEQKRWSILQMESNFPWTSMLAAIETSSDKNIELLEFHPDKASRLIMLRGESNSQKSLVAFIERLEHQDIFKNVHLAHQEKIVRERLETVGFEIKAFLR